MELNKSCYEQSQEGFRARRQAAELVRLTNLSKGKRGDVEVIGHKSPNGDKDEAPVEPTDLQRLVV